MFKPLDILDDTHKILRQKSKDVDFPLSKDDKETIDRIIKHLTYSQIEKYAEKYDLRPGMGLAFLSLVCLNELLLLFMNMRKVNLKIM